MKKALYLIKKFVAELHDQMKQIEAVITRESMREPFTKLNLLRQVKYIDDPVPKLQLKNIHSPPPHSFYKTWEAKF